MRLAAHPSWAATPEKGQSIQQLRMRARAPRKPRRARLKRQICSRRALRRMPDLKPLPSPGLDPRDLFSAQ